MVEFTIFTYVSHAAAKSLQLCPTLCDPKDGSPPGSAVPGILQARTLEWVAISFSNAWKWKGKVKSLSHVRFFATPWTAAYQTPPSTGFSRQEYQSGVPLPSPMYPIVWTEKQSKAFNWALHSRQNKIKEKLSSFGLKSGKGKIPKALRKCSRGNPSFSCKEGKLLNSMDSCFKIDMKWSEVAQSCLTRLLCPWDFPGKSIGVGCHFLLQGIFMTQGSNPGLPHCKQMLYPLSHQGRHNQTQLLFTTLSSCQHWITVVAPQSHQPSVLSGFWILGILNRCVVASHCYFNL